MSDGVELAAGGPAANAAVTCAALGVPATLVTAIGGGPAADVVRADLERHGVRVVDCAGEGFEVPVASVLVERDGARTVVSPGARSSAARPSTEALAALGAARIVLLDGHHPRLAVHALGGPARVVLDAGSPKPHVEEWLSSIDVLAASADYAAGLGLTAEEVVARGLAAGCAGVVVTQGPDEVLWADGGRRGRRRPPTVDAVDTNGAGDAFHGALVAELARGAHLESAVTRAVEVASRRVTSAGARGWLRGLR